MNKGKTHNINDTSISLNQTSQSISYSQPNNVQGYPPNQMPVMYPQPVQPVPVVMAPVPQAVPVQYNAAPQPVVIQAPQNDTKTKVIIIEEQKRKPKNDNCCYCRGPRQSPCGCLDPNEDYCCFLVVMAYVLMSLQYILMCLCIISFCRGGRRACC